MKKTAEWFSKKSAPSYHGLCVEFIEEVLTVDYIAYCYVEQD